MNIFQQYFEKGLSDTWAVVYIYLSFFHLGLLNDIFLGSEGPATAENDKGLNHISFLEQTNRGVSVKRES
jgi:hypothetical protein